MNTDELVTKVAMAINDARYWNYRGNPKPWDQESADGREYCLRLAQAAIEATGITTLRQEVERYRTLISEESIEHLAEDIACAVIDPRSDVVAMRHSAMVRLGERLRDPLPNDLKFARSSLSGNKG